MGLVKEKDTGKGFSINYWNIKAITKRSYDDVCDVLIAGYVSKAVREQNVEAQIEEEYRYIEIPKSMFLDGNVYEYTYSKIKESQLGEEGNEMNWFADAVDEI